MKKHVLNTSSALGTVLYAGDTRSPLLQGLCMPPSQLLASGNNGVIDTLSANPFLLRCFLSVSFLFLLLSLHSP